MNEPEFEHKPSQVLPSFRLTVRSEWIDSNRHMNAAFYTVAVKDAAMAAHEEWDYGDAFRARTNQSNFVLDTRVVYFRELLVGTPLKVTTRITDLDDRRLWLLFEILNVKEGYLAALVRYLVIHVDMGPPPRAARLPADLHLRLEAVRRAHAMIPLPQEAERFDRKDLYNSRLSTHPWAIDATYKTP